MTNAFYNHDSPFTPGSTIRSDEANAKFDGAAVGFDSVQVETKRSIKLPAGADVEISENAGTRANKVIGFNADGNVVIQPGVGTYKNNWATSTTYNLRDIVRDSAGALGLNNLYICSTAHTSSAFASDAANWDLLVDVAAIEVLKNQAAASAAEALTSEGLAEADKVQTGLDRIATNADVVSTNADASTATTQAGIATTQAGNATTQASNASGSATSASTSAGTATTQAGIATAQAGTATTQASNASASASSASTSASTATTQASTSTTQAGIATTQASTSTTQAGIATTQAGIATTQAELATSAKVAAELAYDSFDDRYLGSKASAPTLDNDGNALLTGALYWDTTLETIQAYSGTEWIKASASVIDTITQELVYTATASQTVFSGADDNGTSLLMDTASSVLVHLSGAKLIPTVDYTVDSVANSVTLTVGATVGDSLAVTSFNYLATTELNAANIPNASNLPARNSTLNKEAVTQGTSTRTGMSSTLYTGNGTSQAISTGVDMSTGDFGGFLWIKDRSAAQWHGLFDTIRGTGRLYSNDTSAENTTGGALSTFDTTGFSVGSHGMVNANTDTYIAWSFQTNQKFTGTTNRNKAYTAHYNTELGFSIVGYAGDGVTGHEIPHHLGVKPELTIFKNRSGVGAWVVSSTLYEEDEILQLHSTSALSSDPSYKVIKTPDTLITATETATNGATSSVISYNFASKAGVSKVGKYIGTGGAGNYVDCGFKAGWMMVKNLTSAGNWEIWDGKRGSGSLEPNTSNVENVAGSPLTFTEGGFVLTSSNANRNTLNDEYLFLAFAETNLDATKSWTDYDYATTQDTLSIAQNTLISFANGFSASGQQDTQENVGAGVTYTLGVGHEDKHYWLYKDKAGSYGVSEYRPLEGLTRNDADTWGEVSPLDESLRTTAKHFGYESPTGVVLESGFAFASWEGYAAFNKTPTFNLKWLVASTTTSWLQYKSTEKRVLKSWRMSSNSPLRDPRRFTIEGSNDGFVWVAIDSTYTASNYSGNGGELWGNLQSTSANTTAYLYHRINITANNGDATYTAIKELEFNTILPSDYYLVNEGVMYNNAGTAIERTYLAELMTNTDGEVSWYKNLPIAKQRFNSVDVHGDLLVKGEISNRGVATAWVNFNGSENPPLIRASEGVKDVVDTGTGTYTILWDTELQDGYTLTGSVRVNSQAQPAGIQMSTLAPTSAKIITGTGSSATVNGSNADNGEISLVVFGGKS